MEVETSFWSLFRSSFSFLFFFFTIFFSSFSVLLYFLKMRPLCNCEVCHSYLTRSWAIKFDNLCDWYTDLLRRSPTQTMHIHILGNTITANPENVEYLLKSRFENYPKGKPFSTILGDLLGRGIFNVDGDLWRFQRKVASLELRSLPVRSHAYQIVADEIDNRLLPLLADRVQDGHVLDLQDMFRRFAFDSICNISFGVDPGCLELSLPTSQLAVAFDLASKLSAKRATSAWPLIWKIKRLLNLGSERKLKEAIGIVNRLAEEVISQRRKMGFSGRHDLLSRFMGTAVNDAKYLRDIVISFLLAGRDTVASGLTTFFWLIARFPEVESKIRSEIMEAMARGEQVPSYEQLKGMHYLHAALYESMRLYPPVQFDSKFALEDDVLPDGTFIKRGSRVTYHPYAMGRMEEVWGGDCLQFKPDRWLNNGVFAPESPYKYPVFQAGLRVCLGKEMALVEMKTVAVSMIRRFKIEILDENHSPKFAAGLTATLNGGLPVLVHDISSSKL